MKNSKNKKGFALPITIFTLGILTVIGVIYLKRSGNFIEESTTLNRQQFFSSRARSGTDLIREKFKNVLRARLTSGVIENIQNLVITQATSDQWRIPASAGLGTEESFELRCISTPCTTDPAVLPKTFQLTYRVRDGSAFTVVRQTFEIGPAPASKFALVVTDSASDVVFGSATFAGNMVVNFQDENTGNIRFVNGGAGAAKIGGALVTNAKTAAQIQRVTGAPAPVIDNGIQLKSDVDIPKTLKDDFDKEMAVVTHDFSTVARYTVELGLPASASESDKPCHIRILRDGVQIYKAIPNAGESFLLGGATTVSGPTDSDKGQICKSVLVLALGDVTIRSSIIKKPGITATEGNLTIKPRGDVLIDKDTKLLTGGAGTTIAAQRAAGNWPTLSDSDASNDDSLVIQAAIAPAGKNSSGSEVSTSFKIADDVFATSNPAATTAATAKNLGNLNIEGTLVSGQSTNARRTVANGAGVVIDGFNRTNITWNKSYAIQPPPGLNFSVGGLEATVLSSTESVTDLQEAISETAPQSN